VRIMTGAPCPAGGTVVPWERTTVTGDSVMVSDPADLAPRRNIARQGEDGRTGAVILTAGMTLTPVLLAVAAMAGATRLEVLDPPTVAVITTGDELGTAIADSNGPLLAALLAAWGCPARRDHAGDDVPDLRAALERQASTQVLVTTGGVGGSERDLVKPVATSLGFVEVFHEIAMQPGKPVLLMRHGDGRLLVGLPGNPVSVLATAHLILADLLSRLGARSVPNWTTLPAAHGHTAKGRRLLFQPAQRTADGHLALIPWNGSGDLLAAAAADGLAEIPVGAAWQAGAPLRFLAYGGTAPGSRAILPPRARA
jgi:molybdopterin molybdotransferase